MRLQKKKEWLQRKDKRVEVEISGGCLAHMCNTAFKRQEENTFFLLLGRLDSGGVARLRGCWCPAWEMHKDPAATLDLQDPSLKKLYESKSDEVLGFNIVKPNGEGQLSQYEFDLACKLQKECSPGFVTVITGNDRMSHFFRMPETFLTDGPHEFSALTIPEIHANIPWVGPASLYYCEVVSQQVATLQEIEEHAARSLLQRKDKSKVIHRRVKVPSSTGTDASQASTTWTSVAEELGCFGKWLTDHIAEFGSPNMPKEFDTQTQSFPLASNELRKTSSHTCPEDVSSAAKLLKDVLDLQHQLQIRVTKRDFHDAIGHTFDGTKWKRKPSNSSLVTPPAKRSRDTPTPSSGEGGSSQPMPSTDSALSESAVLCDDEDPPCRNVWLPIVKKGCNKQIWKSAYYSSPRAYTPTILVCVPSASLRMEK